MGFFFYSLDDALFYGLSYNLYNLKYCKHSYLFFRTIASRLSTLLLHSTLFTFLMTTVGIEVLLLHYSKSRNIQNRVLVTLKYFRNTPSRYIIKILTKNTVMFSDSNMRRTRKSYFYENTLTDPII